MRSAFTETTDRYVILSPPENVGAYKIGGPVSHFVFHFERKPCWLHRIMSKLLLGWEWEDYKK